MLFANLYISLAIYKFVNCVIVFLFANIFIVKGIWAGNVVKAGEIFLIF